MRRHKYLLLLAVVCAGGFVWGLAELFRLRFEAGDVYPAYSTLRSDPLGASAFYEALDRMPGVKPGRDFRPDNRMPAGPGTAYLHLAGETNMWEEMPERAFQAVDEFVRTGGRLVVAFEPVTTANTLRLGRIGAGPPIGTNAARGTNFPPGRVLPPGVRPARGDPFAKTVAMSEKWGVGYRVENLKLGDDGAYQPVEVLNGREPSLPVSLTWHSGAVFAGLDPAWRVIYARGTNAVMIERQLGAGSVVLATDSFFVSNEAMARDRQAELLAWLVGPSRQVIFDEAHLGIVQQPGVAMLVRQYRLGGLVASLILLAGLFVWKNTSSLAPPMEDLPGAQFVEGRDSAAGFVNLLRRHIAPREVLPVCLNEWRKSGLGARHSAARLARAQAVIDAENARPVGERNAVRTYREICEALTVKH